MGWIRLDDRPDTLTTAGRKAALYRAAEMLTDLGLRRDLGSNRGVSIGEAICKSLSRERQHKSPDVCRQLMTEVAATLGCATLHEARARFADMTAEHWAIRLRAIADGKL